VTRLVIETARGRIAGLEESGVAVFRGIPYGAPTWGTARFRPPIAPLPWAGIRQCDAYGPSAPPTLTAADRAFFQVSPLWSVYAGLDEKISFGEDCLRLNVWTSGDADARRPVIVWLHGGGFSWGSGSSPLTEGDELARNHDVVVVTVNHRLGVLGYFQGPEDDDEWEDSGVAGLLDLRLALEWVQDNISAFGGDPENVTIAGHSGGGAKVACLLALPSAHGLFRRAIIMSGVVTLRSMTRSEAAESTKRLLDATQLDETDLGRLRELSFDALCSLATGLRFRPVVGERSFPVHPFDPVAAPTTVGVDLMTGVAKDDAAAFKWDSDPTFSDIDEDEMERRVRGLPGVSGADHARELARIFRARFPDVRPARLLVEITTQGLRERTELMVDRKLARSNDPVWMYEFGYDIDMPPETAFVGERMSPHGVELPFVFDIADREWLAGDRPDRIPFGHRVSRYLTNFARTGDPNGNGLPIWPRYDLASKKILTLGT
jgi:para-nitrobenzyl esterase